MILRLLNHALKHGPSLALLVIILFFTIADYFNGTDSFLTASNARRIMHSAALVAVPAIGMTLIIIAGGIDLSAGTAMTLCATVIAVIFRDYTIPATESGAASWVALALACGLGAGVLCGLINGLIVSLTEMVPFIVTLGTMTIFLGTGLIIAGSSGSVEAKKTAMDDGTMVSHLPDWLSNLSYTGPNTDEYLLSFFPIPSSVLIAIVLGALVAAMMHFTVFGRNIVAIGSNPSTARLCGIRVGLTNVCVYAVAGIFVAFGALLFFVNVSGANPSEGTGKELEIIAAVVLGGGSLSGGRGSVFGTIIGALIIKTIASGCTMLDIPNDYTKIIIGTIIILAVLIDGLRNGAPKWLFDRLR
jgi:ribose/xylose/arabinose/galactoside ABC-type transport system permease subunit